MKANTTTQTSAQAGWINKPIDPNDCAYLVCLEHPCGGETLEIGRRELDTYNADPDRYAAKHFGFATADEYREWIETNGTPLCSERTKSGHPCRQMVSRGQLDPAEWKQLHRNVACWMHSKTEAAS